MKSMLSALALAFALTAGIGAANAMHNDKDDFDIHKIFVEDIE